MERAQHYFIFINRISGGCEVDKENNHGSTALMTAVGLGKHEAAKVLLEAGADVNKVK